MGLMVLEEELLLLGEENFEQKGEVVVHTEEAADV